MKNRFFRFLLLTAVIFLAGCVRQEIKNIASLGKNIICFGNSITAGEGVGVGEDYPSLLSHLLGMPVINAGQGGDTSNDGLNRLKQDVLDKDPLLVIIEFGGNDFLRRLPLSEAFNNIAKMTEEIQAKGAMVAIADVSSGLIMENYRKSYKKLARQTRSIFIPNLLSGIITNPSLKTDYIHPNKDGHKILAKKIYLAIKPYLEQNQSIFHRR